MHKAVALPMGSRKRSPFSLAARHWRPARALEPHNDVLVINKVAGRRPAWIGNNQCAGWRRLYRIKIENVSTKLDAKQSSQRGKIWVGFDSPVDCRRSSELASATIIMLNGYGSS